MMLGSHFESDGCDWYWINIMLDTTLGVGIEYFILQLLTGCLEKATRHQGIFRSGEYRDIQGRFIPVKYVSQLAVWLLCVTGMKAVMVMLMIVLRPVLLAAARLFLGIFRSDPKIELVVVMIVTPCCMNALQFWLTDNFIKKHEVAGYAAYAGSEAGGPFNYAMQNFSPNPNGPPVIRGFTANGAAPGLPVFQDP